MEDRMEEILKKMLHERLPEISPRYPFFEQPLPAKRMKKALKTFEGHVAEKDILAFIDFGVFGMGKEGIAFTPDKVFFRYMGGGIYVDYEDIEEALTYKGAGRENKLYLEMKLKNGKTLCFNSASTDNHRFAGLLNDLKRFYP